MRATSCSKEPVSSEYFGLAIYQARKMYGRLTSAHGVNVELSVLIQQGLLGLVEAWQKYDPDRNVLFSTFALPRIYGAIMDYLRHLDPLTQREREKMKRLEEIKELLRKELNKEPEIPEIAKHWGISEDEIREIESLRVDLFSLEDLRPGSIGDDDDFSGDFGAEHSNPERNALERFDQTERTRLAWDVDHCLENVLDAMERSVLIHRTQDDWTLMEVGRLWNVSKDTVKRRDLDARRKMKECLEEKGWETFEVIALITGE